MEEAANRLSVRLWRIVVSAVVGLVFLGVGLFLLRYAWQTHAQTRAFDARARQTSGTVIALDRHDHKRSRSTYAPVYTYRVAGQRYRRVSDVYTSPASYSVGESITVQYDPARPHASTVYSFADRWLILLIAAGAGCLLTLIGLFVAVSGGQKSVAHNRRVPMGMAMIILFMGLLLFFSFRQIGQSIRLLASGERVDGTVVSFVGSKGSGAAPLVRYWVAGQSYDCVGDYDTSPDNRVGDIVPVLYNPDQPAVAKIRSFGVLVSGPLFGLLIISAFIGLLCYRRKQTRA